MEALVSPLVVIAVFAARPLYSSFTRSSRVPTSQNRQTLAMRAGAGRCIRAAETNPQGRSTVVSACVFPFYRAPGQQGSRVRTQSAFLGCPLSAAGRPGTSSSFLPDARLAAVRRMTTAQ